MVNEMFFDCFKVVFVGIVCVIVEEFEVELVFIVDVLV